jgi:hypothetical protein
MEQSTIEQSKQIREMLKAFKQSMGDKLDNLIREAEKREKEKAEQAAKSRKCKICHNDTGLIFSDNICNDCYYATKKNTERTGGSIFGSTCELKCRYCGIGRQFSVSHMMCDDCVEKKMNQ